MADGIIKKRTVFCLLLSLILVAAFICTDRVHAAEAGPKIPYGQDVGNYDPSRDGYYGYLPVAFSGQGADGSGDVNSPARQDAYLPVVVWNNGIYACTRDMKTAAGASVTEKDGKACIQILNRRLYLEAGSSRAVCTLGNPENPYICRSYTLPAKPFRLENELWFPLVETMQILDMEGLFGERAGRTGSCLHFDLPERGVYDILADLYDPGFRSEMIFGYAEHVFEQILPENKAEELSALNSLLPDDRDDVISAALEQLESRETSSGTKTQIREQETKIIRAERTRHETSAALSEVLNRYGTGYGAETGENLREMIHAAASFLQSCYDADLLYNEIRNKLHPDEMRDLSEELPELISDISVLSGSDLLSDKELPLNWTERASAKAGISNEELIGAVTALYITAEGEVRSGSDDSAVEDAQCVITVNGNEAGRFSGTPGGAYRVTVPAVRPEGIVGTDPDPAAFRTEWKFTSPSVEGSDTVSRQFRAGAEEKLETAFPGSFNWYHFIAGELVPETGFADLKDKKAMIASGDAKKSAGWSSRQGIAGADVRDMTFDGQYDLILYRFDSAEENSTKGYTLFADFYTEEKGEVTLRASLPLYTMDGISFRSCRTGIIEVSGFPYLWTECNGNDYSGKDTEFTVRFYGWDGSAFRMIWLNGRSDGGGSGSHATYSFCTYAEDGSSEKIDLYVDSDYWLFGRESDKVFPEIECAGEALEKGYSYLGLPQPEKSYYHNAGWTVYSGWFRDDLFPTYWDTDVLKKSVEVCTSGSRSGWSREMTDIVKDYTELEKNTG